MKKFVLLLTMVLFFTFAPHSGEKVFASNVHTDTGYLAHVSNQGWLSWSFNGYPANPSEANPIEAIKIKPSYGISIRYRVHTKSLGWLPWVYNTSDYAGTVGRALPIEAIQAEVVSGPPNTHVLYRVKSAGLGWLPWVVDSTDYAGTVGQSRSVYDFELSCYTD